MSNITEQVTALIAKHMEVPAEKVIPSARLGEDLGIDSLGAVEVVMAVEEEFDIRVSDDVVDNWLTVADVIKGVEAAT